LVNKHQDVRTALEFETKTLTDWFTPPHLRPSPLHKMFMNMENIWQEMLDFLISTLHLYHFLTVNTASGIQGDILTVF
jgi:hypothetical protein